MALKVKKTMSKMKLIKDNTDKKIVNNFTKKQIKVLEEIKSGKRKQIYDVDFSKEEYLYKDNEGITFLEHLIKNDIYVIYNNLDKSIECAYICCKCGKHLFGFELTEEELFSNINGIRLIDFIVKNNKISSNLIKPIKNNLEIIDILIESHNEYYLSQISDEIRAKLIIPNKDGIYFIEKYIDDEKVIKNLIPLINDSNILIEICKKYNKYDLLKYANSEVLMSNIDHNYTLLDDLLNKNIIPINLLKIPNDQQFINYLVNKKLYEFLVNANEKILLTEIKGKTLLEKIIEKEDIKSIKGYVSDKKTIQILHKYNKLNIEYRIDETLLKESINNIIEGEDANKTLLEYMIDTGFNPLINSYNINDEGIIKILYNKKEYKILGEKLNEKKLLLKMDDGACLIDVLLDNNIQICYTDFKSEELLNKFYTKNRIDLLAKADIDMLLNLSNENQTYFDCVLENIKNNNIKFNLNKISFYGKSANIVAKFYLNIAKHDMIEYVSDLDKTHLLKEYDGKTLLNELLDLDSNLTLDKIISDKVKSEMEISIILNSRGLEQKEINVPLEEKDFTKEYLENFNSSLGIGPLSYEAETLLKKLSDLFLNDGKSDPFLIGALITGYRHSLFVNYDYYINELKNLVSIKEENIDKFVYIKEDSGAFFRPHTGAIHSDTNVVETILHETGHALHSYLVDEKMPENYVDIVKTARTNPETLKKVEEYAKKYNEIKEQILKKTEEKCQTFFEEYYTPEKICDIEKFLKKSKSEKKEEYKELGISDDILDIIVEKSFTKEEYINHQKRIFIRENVDAIYRSEFGAFMAIGDILDAIYEGQLHSGFLKNEQGELIPKTVGHGISYYYDKPGSGFSEMVANFASLCKSKDSREMLILLKSIVGKELFDMLNGFYYRNIIIPKDDKLPEIKLR